MKKKLVVLLLAATMSLSVVACGGEIDTVAKVEEQEKEKIEYIEDSEIADFFTNPDKYKGKYVKLSGKVFADPEKNGDEIALQAWHNPENSSNNFITYYKGDNAKINQGDYIMVDGKIGGEFEGENAFGGTVTAPMLEATSIEVLSYIDAVTPTIAEIVPENATSEQNGISLKVDKIEFAEKETRVYLTETNSSADKFSMWVYSIKITQNGSQIEQANTSSQFEGDYAQLSTEILPNASSSGVLVFPPMDSSASFQIYAEGHSDNYELDFAPFAIDITVK